jgi:hypothetical protein
MRSDAMNTTTDLVIEEIRELVGDPGLQVGADSMLLGDERLLDSTALVELCLRLEDRAFEQGFEFDWTSEDAMSRSRSMFRSVESLSSEFARQMQAQA